MTAVPERFYLLARNLLDCFRVYLLEQENPPGTITMRSGEVTGQLTVQGGTVLDECKCGLAWVRLVRYYPTDVFPQETETWNPCGPAGWAVVLELGALRCAPFGDAGQVPTDEEWQQAVLQQMRDAAAMRKAVDCCFGQMVESETLMTAPWEERPPEGLCMGGTQQVTVLVDACNDC